MRRSAMTLLTIVLLVATPASAGGPILIVTDGHGAAARVGAPVSADIVLATVFDTTVKPEHLQLIERTDDAAQSSATVAVQFVPDSKGSKKGKLKDLGSELE